MRPTKKPRLRPDLKPRLVPRAPGLSGPPSLLSSALAAPPPAAWAGLAGPPTTGLPTTTTAGPSAGGAPVEGKRRGCSLSISCRRMLSQLPSPESCKPLHSYSESRALHSLHSVTPLTQARSFLSKGSCGHLANACPTNVDPSN